MNLWSSGLIASVDKEATRKKLRYTGVSIASVPIGQGLIQVFAYGSMTTPLHHY
jgi:hypothetical protein